MAKEMKRLIVHVYGHEFEVNMSKEKEQLYLLAAEYVNKKINAYMDAFVRKPLPQLRGDCANGNAGYRC